MVKKRLSNGLEVVILQLPHVHSVSHAFMVRTGPRYESREQNGISHLVEHLLLRGTESHPDSLLFHVAVEDLGGEINGLTQRDATTLHITVPPRHARAGLRLLGEVCTEPTMTGIDVERNVVIEEILDTYDNEGRDLDPDALARHVLWEDHPMSQPVAGTAEIVERLTESECRRHYEQTFVAENGVLVIAGPVDPMEMLAEAAITFGRLPQGQPMAEMTPPIPAHQCPIHIQPSDDAQATVLFSYPAPHENDPRFGALLLLKRILDDGFGSRLRQAICEQRGLAYSLSASVDAYGDVACFDVDMACAEQKVVSAVAATLETIRELETLTEAELVRAKTRHVAELEFALDAPSDITGWYGAAALMGQSAGYEDWLSCVMRVSVEDVKALARDMFRPDRTLLTLIGPVDDADIPVLERLMDREPDSTLWISQLDEDTDTEEAESNEDEVVPDLAVA